MPHELTTPRPTSHHQASTPPNSTVTLAPDPALLPLTLISLIEGMRERGLVAGRDEAIGAALTAALTLAIDTHGAGHEEDAITRCEAIFRHLLGEYRIGIKAGRIKGRSHGGFERGRS